MNNTDDRLAGAFNFTEDDLAANRRGYLTPTQKKVLAETRRARGCGARIAYIVMAGSVVIFVVAFILGGGLSAPLSTGALTAYAVALSVFIGVFLLSTVYSRFLSRDLRNGKISVAEGPARRWTKEYKFGAAFFVKIGRRRFQLAYPEQFAVFDNGTYYRVYYVKNPPLHLILSVETVYGTTISPDDRGNSYGKKG